jgi:hypothetical protein
MTILEKLSAIQQELKVNKGQFNAFGKYNYRSAEDILDAIKPFESKYSVLFHITEELKEVAGHVYMSSKASIIDCEVLDRESVISSNGEAIIDFDAKGMQMPQRTGSASSYAKKYALGNLLLIDDTKDSDATNSHDKTQTLSKPQLKVGTDSFAKVQLAIKNGYTIEQVKEKYTLTKAVEEHLTNNK